MLPCYWIYWEVGKPLLEHGSPKPHYQRWIAAYGGEEFGTLVEAVLDLSDRAFVDLNPDQRVRVAEVFFTTRRYEWMFWDAAWRLEEWPI